MLRDKSMRSICNVLYQAGIVVAVSFIIACGGGGGGSDTPEPEANSAPSAVNDSVEVGFQGSVTINVLANDTDQQGDPLTITNLTQPTTGTVMLVGNQIEFQADDESGTVEFTYTANDGEFDSAPATVQVTIADNSLPVSSNTSKSAAVGELVVVDVLEGDIDANGHEMTIEIVSQAAQGSASVVDNKIAYQAGDEFGEFVVTYKAFDGFGYGNTAELQIVVDARKLILKGRVSPAQEGATVLATITSVDSSFETYSANTDENGNYQFDLDLNVTTGVVSLESSSNDEQISYHSQLGTLERLFELADEQEELHYSNYMALELSSFSTALKIYSSWFDEDGFINSTEELESIYAAIDSIEVVKFAATIDLLVNGELDFPNGITSFQQLYDSRTDIEALVTQLQDYEYNTAFIELLNNLTFLTEDGSKIKDNAYAFQSNGSLLDSVPAPIIFPFELDDKVKFLSNNRFVSSGHSRSSTVINFNHELPWEIDEEQNFRIYSTLQDPAQLVFENTYSQLCFGNYNLYVDLDEIVFRPVYLGENITQYLAHYSGESYAGDSPQQLCNGTTKTEWSLLRLVTTNTDTQSLAESASNGLIATRVGKIIDSEGVSISASLVNLNSDNSFLIQSNDQAGEWAISEKGELTLLADDSTEIRYIPIGEYASGKSYVAQKNYSNGDSEIFGGVLVDVDSQYTPDTLVGRFEGAAGFGAEPVFAISIQDNQLGQQESHSNDGSWGRSDPFGEDSYIFSWIPTNDARTVHAEYSIIHDPETFTNVGASIEGCNEADENCYVWRTRDIQILSEDENYHYLMINIMTDLQFFEPDNGPNISYAGYVRAFKKTDFVLPEVERP